MRSDLAAYLRAAARMRFAWGEADCITLVCDWVRAATGRDPMAPWRGTYHSGLQAAERLAPGGGLLATVTHGMEDLAGLRRIQRPGDGDVAVVRLHAPLCAIRAGDLFAARRARGLLLQPAQVLRAWALC